MDLVLEPLASSIYCVEVGVGEPLPLFFDLLFDLLRFFSIRSQSITPSCICQEGPLEWGISAQLRGVNRQNGIFCGQKSGADIALDP
jgi:hypothetical protein